MNATAQSVFGTLWRYSPLLLLAVAWELVSRFELVSSSALPPLSDVVAAWIDMIKSGELLSNTGISLYRGGMGMGGMDIGRPLGTSTCALTLQGRPAPSHRMQLTRPAHGDTLNVDTPNTVIRNAVGLQLIILTHSAEREAQLLAAAQSLEVGPPKSP